MWFRRRTTVAAVGHRRWRRRPRWPEKAKRPPFYLFIFLKPRKKKNIDRALSFPLLTKPEGLRGGGDLRRQLRRPNRR
ncbi:hypothetical protein EPI10_000426 [Gossypium australe]|uniref:Uncharacterized protein n=1 Tax=Gossypium australe TaxID=47621 RepID=A0A5B6V874_9ROSI|nr:hypothetical protein EPI10_000426 [Gossypium australe]